MVKNLNLHPAVNSLYPRRQSQAETLRGLMRNATPTLHLNPFDKLSTMLPLPKEGEVKKLEGGSGKRLLKLVESVLR